jgi:hypothetical protein
MTSKDTLPTFQEETFALLVEGLQNPFLNLRGDKEVN